MSVAGAVTINHSEIVGNAAQGTKGIGGGIYTSTQGTGSSLLVTDSAISGNTATMMGGGAYLGPSSASAEFQRVTFNENSATQDGGGIETNGRRVVLRDSTMSRNTAGRDGGGVHLLKNGQLVINGSTLNNNTAGGNGGGVAVTAGTVNTINSTFSANRATLDGGALWSANGASLNYSTFFQNRADHYGGGVFFTAGTGNIRNTVIAANTAPFGRDISGLLGTTLELHYSLIGSNQNSGLTPAPVSAPDANGNIIGGNDGVNPRLGSLANNGGPTLTHMPLNESPLINHGDPSVVAGQQEAPQFDQRGAGFPRVARERLDIGAVEVQPVIIAGDFDASGTVDTGDYLIWRKAKGSATDLRADSNGDGQVTEADLDAWYDHYGDVVQLVAVPQSASRDMPVSPDAVEPSGTVNGTAEAPVTLTRIAVARRPQFTTNGAADTSSLNSTGLLAWVADENSRSRPTGRSVAWSSESGESSVDAAASEASTAFDEAFAGLASN
jgi:predicted outer membrane repeat protein